jgi:hypothetical protein
MTSKREDRNLSDDPVYDSGRSTPGSGPSPGWPGSGHKRPSTLLEVRELV